MSGRQGFDREQSKQEFPYVSHFANKDTEQVDIKNDVFHIEPDGYKGWQGHLSYKGLAYEFTHPTSESCYWCSTDEIKQKSDPVNSPSHYKTGGIETISFIRAKLTKDEFIGYCMGNVLKYTIRYKHKNGVEDLNKAKVYLQWAIERMSEDGEQS